MDKVNLEEKFSAFSEHWRPKVVGELNGQEVKIVKFQGQFVWHKHEAEDELFLVWRGRLRVEFRDRVAELEQTGDTESYWSQTLAFEAEREATLTAQADELDAKASALKADAKSVRQGEPLERSNAEPQSTGEGSDHAQ